MNIKQIMEHLDGEARYYRLENIIYEEIQGIAFDSRNVDKGYLFVAISGAQADGHDYIAQARENGAIAVLAEREVAAAAELPLIVVTDSRRSMAKLAGVFYGHPDHKLHLIGVTGTNGKTTTTNLIKWLLDQNGRSCGLIGTIENKIGDKVIPSRNTTPESVEFYQMLAAMVAQGDTNAVAEISSHALSQGRVDACRFHGAVFTNLTQDHLDYHGNYRQCKLKLFTMLGQTLDLGYGVINVDDPSAAEFAQACSVPLWTYGMQEGATLRLLSYIAQGCGMDFELKYEGAVFHVHIPLGGKFNIYNAMAAMAVVLAEGVPMAEIIPALSMAPQVAGRFELIDCGQDFTVVVDYAHTPDGLSNVLTSARELTQRRLISVFGCGGNRDSGKRPIMGRIAGSLSDVAIITSDNPRFEDPLEIIDQIERGMKEVCTNYLVEPSRADAIAMALKLAEAGDMVVIAGKGHENYQIIGNAKHHFDDRETVRTILDIAK
ncbi:MAG: UDP-N-acetylmuramoyl-L-alanyl-D-glutamate--2,6-diaminopimelate ligase [Clostridiales bacterium]